MADRGNYVDIFFRNGLKEFEVLPPPEVWENIKPALIHQEKSLTFFRIAAIAAILVSLSAFSIWLTNDLSKDFSGLAFSLNQEVIPAGSYVAKNLPVKTQLIIVGDRIPEIPLPIVVEENRTAEQVFFKIPYEDLSITPPKDSKLHKEVVPVLSTVFIKSPMSSGVINFKMTSVSSGKESKSTAVNRWTISANASPNYYSKVNSGSDQAASEMVDNEKPEVTFSGGMAFSYNLGKRISIQSGVYYSTIGQKITGINSYSGFSSFNNSKGSSQFSVQTSSGMIVSSDNNIFLRDKIATRVLTPYTIDVFDPAKAKLTYLNNFISQSLNYLEIPILFKYKAIDRKIDINLVGGLSYNILVGNSASASLNGVKYSIGKTEGVSPANYSSSFGLGFEYNLSKKFSLDLQPTFRYYLTPLGDVVGSSVHPYSFGVFTGLSYKF
jgi:hypothetical protein